MVKANNDSFEFKSDHLFSNNVNEFTCRQLLGGFRSEAGQGQGAKTLDQTPVPFEVDIAGLPAKEEYGPVGDEPAIGRDVGEE